MESNLLPAASVLMRHRNTGHHDRTQVTMMNRTQVTMMIACILLFSAVLK